MVEDSEAVPEPSTLDELADDPARKGAVAFLVHVEPETGRTVRINITARDKQLEVIDRLADEAGMTRSAYMVRSALGGLAGQGGKQSIAAGRPRAKGKPRYAAR